MAKLKKINVVLNTKTQIFHIGEKPLPGTVIQRVEYMNNSGEGVKPSAKRIDDLLILIVGENGTAGEDIRVHKEQLVPEVWDTLKSRAEEKVGVYV